jgi:hypothetical protein
MGVTLIWNVPVSNLSWVVSSVYNGKDSNRSLLKLLDTDTIKKFLGVNTVSH